MVGFICLTFLLIILIAVSQSGRDKNSKRKGSYVYLYDEDGEIVDSYLDKSIPYHSASEDDDFDDCPGGIRMGDGSIMVTDDDDYMEEFGEEML